MFRCPTCLTVMSIETALDKSKITPTPICPCNQSKMIDMATAEYAYGRILYDR